MAVKWINVTCEGYSGEAAGFVTQVSLQVGSQVVGSHLHLASDAPWTFSGALDIEGAATVQVFDRTAGNDYDRDNGTTEHGGPGDNLHGTYVLDCPVQEDLDSQPNNPSSEPEPLITLPLPVLVVEPSVPTTLVELSTVAPGTYSGLDDFYVAVYETEGEPVGCCVDYVAEVGTAPMLPATGPEHILPMVGLGMGLVVLGIILCRNAKKAPQP